MSLNCHFRGVKLKEKTYTIKTEIKNQFKKNP